MEPTIYKPRIYNGAGIYNNGSGGGGGGGGGALFGGKNFSIFSTYGSVYSGAKLSTRQIDLIDSDATGCFSIVPDYVQNSDNINKFEVSLHCIPYCYQQDTSKRLYLICTNRLVSSYEFSQVQIINNKFYFLAGADDYVNDQSFTQGTEYIINVTCERSGNNFNYTGKINGNIVGTFSKETINRVVSLSFGGSSSLENKLGKGTIVYSQGTYIKVNDNLIFGEE